jgi:nucleoside-diphosphate-sugar epimerase
MVIGNGLVGQRFLNDFSKSENTIIFASGVSNSKCIEIIDYEREINLLNKTILNFPKAHFVYFSTCSIYDPSETSSQYVLHKKHIEEIISSQTSSYHIFRVSNIVGNSTNKNTIINFFYDKINRSIPFDLWSNASRNLIDIDDMYKIVFEIIKENYKPNSIINVANPVSYSVLNIIRALELHLKKDSLHIETSKGTFFEINTQAISTYIDKLNIKFDSNYLQNLLTKYFPINDV